MPKISLKKILSFQIETLFTQWWWKILFLNIFLSLNLIVLCWYIIAIPFIAFVLFVQVFFPSLESFANSFSGIVLATLHILFKIFILIILYKKSNPKSVLGRFFNRYETDKSFALLNIVVIILMDVLAFLIMWLIIGDWGYAGIIYLVLLGGGLLSYLALMVFLWGKKLANRTKK